MKAYPELRQSRIQWMNHVPAHWTEKRIKYLAQVNPPKSEVRGWAEETEVTFLPMESIGERGELDASRSKPIGEVINGYTYFGEGDVLLAKITPCFENGKGAIASGLLNGIGFATTEVIPLRCFRECDNRFLYYLLYADPFRAIAEGSMYGAGGQKRVADSFVANYPAEFPTLSEQAAIATFLDRETAKIDTLIDKQEQLIKLLEEKRQAVISHAVTKGLNPDVRMKDSGVEWLGEVPEHWDVSQLRYEKKSNTSITYGIVQAGPNVEDGIPYIRTGDMSGADLPESGYLKTSPEIDRAYKRSKVFSGDIVIAIRATVGKCLPLPRSLDGANLTQGTAKFSSGDRVTQKYVLHYLSSNQCQNQFASLSKGATFKEITLDSLRRIDLPVPPVHEQGEIVDFIDTKISGFDELVGLAKKQAAILKERRTALISAAVTGKIDVREAV